MNGYFEAIAWCMERMSVSRSGVSMSELGKWLMAYNKEVREPNGEPPLAHSRANLYRKFESVDNALERTRSYLVALERPVPSALESYVLTTKKVARDPSAGVWNADASVEVLKLAFDRAQKHSDEFEQVVLAQHLSGKLLRESGQSDESLQKAYEVAETGYRVAEVSSSRSRSRRLRNEQMLCARAAAWAAVRRSRVYINQADKTNGFLYLVETWKRRESALASTLRLPVTSEIAQFHAKRASALIRNDREDSISNLRDIAHFLLAARTRDHGTDANDRVRYHDLTSIVQRLCATDWAFSTHSSYQYLIGKYFPEGIDDVVKKLLDLYEKDERGLAAREDASALIELKKANDALLEVYDDVKSNPLAAIAKVGDKELLLPDAKSLYRIVSRLEVWTFLRVHEHSALHALAMARYAVAVHDIEIQGDPTIPDFPVNSDRLLSTARDFCERAWKVTRPKAVDESILERVSDAQKEVNKRLSSERHEAIRKENRQAAKNAGPDFRDGERAFPVVAEEMLTRLVLTALTSERLTFEQSKRIESIAQTIHRYLGDSRSTVFSGGIDRDPA